ncbi:anti-sigma factor domain-containing protein [Streptomyces sp. NPDC001922]|uniref:anti-sigma factor n=1 Tax=Streptomyces sp. NPDC001922 TaxID=3364624 RepID=UPI00369F8A2B
MKSADLHTLTGAYATQALPEAEREEFERHLVECAPCAQEVRELTATAGRLGLAVSMVPPPEMKDRVMRQIVTVRQEPPRISRRRVSGPSRRRARSPYRFALAACLAAAAGLGGVAVWQHQQVDDARQVARQAEQRQEEITKVLAAPDARATGGKLKDGASATVVVSRSQNKAAFLASGLPPLPSGKVYQLWFADGGKMRSAGLVEASAQPAMLMRGPVGDASGMGITVEPAGGSEQPTTDPLALMEFPPGQGV